MCTDVSGSWNRHIFWCIPVEFGVAFIGYLMLVSCMPVFAGFFSPYFLYSVIHVINTIQLLVTMYKPTKQRRKMLLIMWVIG